MKSELPIIFHPDYAIQLPAGHRFPIGKFLRIKELLLIDGIISKANLRQPEPITEHQLLMAHTSQHIEKVFALKLDKVEQRQLGMPLSSALVKRGCAAVGGTLLAARLALTEGLACNIAGGSHHAFPGHAAGFCLFNDIAVAIRVLEAESIIKKALVIDLDVHQGDGTAVFFQKDPEFFTFSIHCDNNYPSIKQRSDLDIAVPSGTGDAVYLSIVKSHIIPLLNKTMPDIVFYNAGVDPHCDDKLGKLNLSDIGLRDRDRHVICSCLSREIPLVCVVGGGYADNLDILGRRHGALYQSAIEMFEKISR
jgi:acetoin utilization deacetylase AcuC-like enzyme